MEISLRDFIITIKNTRIYGRNMVTLINKLFEAGNSIPIPSDETVKKWIAKTNPIKCPGEKYFDDKKKAFDGFVDFFKDGVDENQFKILKESFCNSRYKFEKRFVDFETENEDVICYSLANIFLDTINMTKFNLSKVLPKDNESFITTTPQHKTITPINNEEPHPLKTPELLLLEHYIGNFGDFGVDIFIGINSNTYSSNNQNTAITDVDKDWKPSASDIKDMLGFIARINYYIEKEATEINNDYKNNIEKFITIFQKFMDEINNLAITPYTTETLYVNWMDYEPTNKCTLQKIRKEYCESLTPLYNQLKEEYDKKSAEYKREWTEYHSNPLK